jgi:hypothetical protein
MSRPPDMRSPADRQVGRANRKLEALAALESNNTLPPNSLQAQPLRRVRP